jgi:hypothetical protein
VSILQVDVEAGHTALLVLRNPVVAPLDLVHHALRQLALRQVAPVVHHRNLGAQGDLHLRAQRRLVRSLLVPRRRDVRKELAGKPLQLLLNISLPSGGRDFCVRHKWLLRAK